MPDALVELLGDVPGVVTVTRGEQYRVTRRGGIYPLPASCPEVRLSPGPVREVGLDLSGNRRRRSDYLCDLWVYEDDVGLETPAWDALRDGVTETLKEARASLRLLPGVTDVRMIAEQPPKRALTSSKQGLLHSIFTVQAWETV